MEYNQIYISISTVTMRLGHDPRKHPCSLCERTVSNGWCFNEKTNRLYCSKECSYRDTGEYYAAKLVTTLTRPKAPRGLESDYDKQNALTRQIRLEAEQLLDDILRT